MTFVAHTKLTAAQMNALEAEMSLGAWTAFVPTFIGLVQGNGTVVARYRQIGKTVEVRFHLTCGSTTTYSAVFGISLPVQPHASYLSTGDPMGSGYVVDSSATTRYSCTAVYWSSSGDRVFLVYANNTVALSTPFTFAVSDTVACQLVYEAS